MIRYYTNKKKTKTKPKPLFIIIINKNILYYITIHIYTFKQTKISLVFL